jgi:hypothetical protein
MARDGRFTLRIEASLAGWLARRKNSLQLGIGKAAGAPLVCASVSDRFQ